MERFFLNLKMERVWQRLYASHDEARRDISQYIVCFYNAVRCIRLWAICHPHKATGFVVSHVLCPEGTTDTLTPVHSIENPVSKRRRVMNRYVDSA
jgi:transposase InsO family protein